MRKQVKQNFRVASAGDSDAPEFVEIQLTALDGVAGSELGIRLVQLFGPGITGLVAAMDSNDMSKVTEAASTLFAKLSPSEFTSVRKQLLRNAQAQDLGEFHDVDDRFISERFAGHPGSLVAVVGQALKLNFSSFFEDLGISKEKIAKLTSRVEAGAKKAGVTT